MFLPSKEKFIIAAGDKSGHIGLWDADCELEGDGVHIYRPHTSPVSAIVSHVYDITKLISCSYDGYARVLDMGKSVFNVVHASVKILTALCYSSDSASCVYLGDDEGTMRCVDIRDRNVSFSIGLHNRRINSVQLNPQRSHLMLTGSTDGTACLWDIRHLRKSCLNNLAKLKHPRAVQSAYFSPSGNHIASTSYDDCVRVWSGLFQNTLTAHDSDALQLDEPAIIPHNNQTNRWLSSFRAIWGWNDSLLFVGNMSRAIDVLSVEEKRVTASLRADNMTSIPCRFACHSLLPGLLAGGTAGGKVYFWR
ncbi:hypothetical protein O6H91_13G039200 [Diphasiastrum complanatum]|nr:hypothetical protein O6H91_13G039200 [Diphasiastrum complanatum]KAJ7533241.1 hypothetical protein O6H91_13G039200 [Diphasiastrum complanatum]